ncbi:dihydroneopterin aldolase [Marinobacter sp. CHS3-4]|uniref:dihydroneopterin aldolase n=1 Tax=Marinobacter sp. CHS3-4 TaxID=3045174 RepID=UPI0024B61011|nr:dihydroneopterin aldolase [Marinobacter sp. CHS3-4]MDI9246579.1 dihydroneopterin aldolase [Marinobacter sp. CHS3-4]
MVDTVFIEGLAVETIIGVYDWEREVDQRLLIDLEMAWNNSIPGRSDDVSDALDYAAVSEKVIAYLQEAQPRLLETAAEGLAGLLQEEFHVHWVRLSIRKPGAVASANAVGVSIERGVR